MKKKVVTTNLKMLLCVGLIVLMLQGCGSKQEFTIKPQSTQIKGILGSYLEVKDGQVKIQKVKEDGKEWSISIPIKRIKKPLNACNHFDLNMDITLFDSKGQPINMDKNFTASVTYLSTDKKICSLLEDDNTQEDYIVFTKFAASYEKAIQLPDDIATFSIGSGATYQGNGNAANSLEEDMSDKGGGSSNEQTSANTETPNQDWNKLLKDYEDYTDKYIELLKKVNKKDMSAMNDYQDIYEKAERLGNDLEKAQDNMSPEQLSKMVKIQTKLANAALEMTK